MFGFDECNDETWYGYFRENMDGMGLAAPETVYGTVETALFKIGPMITAVHEMGGSMKLRTIIGAGSSVDKLLVAGAGAGSYYVGGAAGSAVVATARYFECGKSLLDMMMLSRQIFPGKRGDWVRQFIWNNPEVVRPRSPRQRHFRMKALRAAKGAA